MGNPRHPVGVAAEIRYECPSCTKRYASVEWFGRHLRGHGIVGNEAGRVVTVQWRHHNRVTPSPFEWRVMPGRLFVKHDGGPWRERAYLVDHFTRTIKVSGVVTGRALPPLFAAARVRLAGEDVGPSPLIVGPPDATGRTPCPCCRLGYIRTWQLREHMAAVHKLDDARIDAAFALGLDWRREEGGGRA